ncbi:uncharacterized protein C8R40DRAFT_307344 [Lentinula edodes]|uniref:uncharacterized protein n=1 Tax=Lentinula edodes TaxID=5353 RepID=UPI001E8E2B26|nr:uncharacterized protein C8R40DRAFT_307344 [Lentinula edodes]KAH7874791.1 hypothetical protein C8R40DRAFT_307344 [Lentinula edodes]
MMYVCIPIVVALGLQWQSHSELDWQVGMHIGNLAVVTVKLFLNNHIHSIILIDTQCCCRSSRFPNVAAKIEIDNYTAPPRAWFQDETAKRIEIFLVFRAHVTSSDEDVKVDKAEDFD